MRVARAAALASTGAKRAGLENAPTMVSAIMSGVDVANSLRRPSW
ncbi:hypothetical protein [Bradyrhizobium sp.]|nr:hypothetical protein [Bradyrhizobium sp.]